MSSTTMTHQNDEVAIAEALGVNTRVVLGAQKTKFSEAVVQVAVPQQRGLLETIHIEQKLEGMAIRDGDALRCLQVHALVRRQDAI